MLRELTLAKPAFARLLATVGVVWSVAIASSSLFAQPAVTLSCFVPPFLSNLSPSQPIIIGEIQRHGADGSIWVKVQERLIGRVDQTMIHLDSRSYSYWSGGPSVFPLRSRWVFRLNPSKHDGFDYAISPCINPPKVTGDQVYGALLDQTHQTMPLTEFRQRVKQGR